MDYKIKKEKIIKNLKVASFIIPMISISFVHFIIFWVYVNVDTIRLTFFDWNPVKQDYIWNDFYNYTVILKNVFLKEDIVAYRSFWNTFHSLGINLIILPFSLIIAYTFYKKVFWEKAFRVIFYLPSIISLVVLTMAYRAMFRQGTGPVAQFFAMFGYTPSWTAATEESTTIWPLIYIFAVLAGMGTNVILMNSAMLRIPTSVVESARIDGCGYFREMLSITLPLIMPTITTWITVIMTGCLGFFMQPMLIGGSPDNGKTMTIPWIIFNAAAKGDSNKNALIGAATNGVILSLFVMPFVFVARFLCNKFTPEVEF